ncbi:hemolysin III family protein [Paenibacillus sp. N1-5-1-14]|uniref:PAQR family membrane homeostasis protein TrhA n=1 Tax=Paenibacillus radicibacter TaxID=2972488 RepID=UPI002158A4AC|nr:hemolysin III family protein [Paenibacillus radicibacter]MCR8641328.1 hemolysin III family protein [Paenibacillus radicibacter]
MHALTRESLYSAITHGIGIPLSLAGTYILMQRAFTFGTPWHMAGFLIFGITMLHVYTSSTLLHSSTSMKWGPRFELLDYLGIYLFIAGSYTAFIFIGLRNNLGWTMLAIVWLMAIIGIALTFWGWFTKYRLLTTYYYVAMGVFTLLFIQPFMQIIPLMGVMWLILGDLLYIIGTFFFMWKSLRYHHAIWHLFVLGGSICHFVVLNNFLLWVK